MADIEIRHIDDTYVQIICESHFMYEMKGHFSFFAKNYKYAPKYKAGLWNGKIGLIDRKNRIYKGLLPDVITWAEHNNYTIDISDVILNSGFDGNDISVEKIYEFYHRIGGKMKPLDSQIAAFKHCVENGRSIILAPTANGKSYIIHGLVSFYAKQKKKVLIIIDRSQLVEQLRENMRDEYKGDLNYVTIYDKVHDRGDVFITTWQSIYKNDASWFKSFNVIIGDEVHKFKADSLKAIMEKCGHISIRHGFTATLDNDSVSDRLILKGMFGTPFRVATAKELIDAGVTSKPTIHAILIKYPDEFKRKIANKKHKTPQEKFAFEVKTLEMLRARNEFIAELNKRIKGNTLVAFKHIEHGDTLHEMIGGDAHLIHSKVNLSKRMEISRQIDDSTDATGVVSIGTFSTGVNIKNINNIIIACQLQSKITVPQLIGRGQRRTATKTTLAVYDIGDDLTWNGKDNITLKHFKERLQIYADMEFDIKIHTHKLTW